MAGKKTETDQYKVSYRDPSENHRDKWQRLHVIRNLKFETKLILLAMAVAIIPLINYAYFSMNNFRSYSLRNAENDLEQIAHSLYMLCEAQEALDRLKKREVDTAADAVTGASPSWRDGNELQSLSTIIKDIHVAETGYCYVFDSKGSVIIHPVLENKDYNKLEEPLKEVFTKLRDEGLKLPPAKVGTLRYPWPDPDGKVSLKIAKFIYFKPYDWIIGVGAHEEEILRPYQQEKQFFTMNLLITLIAVIAIVLIVARLLMRPVRQLTKATTQIAAGDMDAQLPTIYTNDEIGSLARSFRMMITKLRHAHNDLMEWSKTLEQKVEKRSEQLKKVHERMLMSEKMASLGKLSAMVAHEINNPLSGILSYLKLSMKLIDRQPLDEKQLASIRRHLDISANEVKRVGDIVRNLLMFSKRSFGEFGSEHLNSIIDKSVALIKHSLDVKNIKLVKEIGDGDDLLYCDGSGLQQMFLALMVNANEAMDDSGGQITIRTDYQPQEVKIRLIDTGKGIPDDVLPHIFEPFFSHKESKKSIGMGLSVVYGIVASHKGTINVESKIKQGTTFIITLPRLKPEEVNTASTPQP